MNPSPKRGTVFPKDPFAGYTPVKVTPPVVDELPQRPAATGVPRRYRFAKKREGNVSLTVKLVGWLVFSVLLIGLIAAVSYGFVYEQQVEEPLPEAVSNHIQRLAVFGRDVREKVREVLPGCLGGSGDKDAEDGAATNKVMRVEKAFPAVGAFVEGHKRLKQGMGEEVFEANEGHDVVATNVVPVVKKREVDPALKRFKGGRSGRRIGNGERK